VSNGGGKGTVQRGLLGDPPLYNSPRPTLKASGEICPPFESDPSDLLSPRRSGSAYERELQATQTTETEARYLEGFLDEWRQLLREEYRQLRSNLEEDILRLKRVQQPKVTDLGTEFNDMRLNMRVKRKAVDGGQECGTEMNVISSTMVDGSLQFTCCVCSVSVLGKKNIDSHLDGKKHNGKMVDWDVIGKFSLLSKLCLFHDSLWYVRQFLDLIYEISTSGESRYKKIFR
jgi:hypothetical protein